MGTELQLVEVHARYPVPTRPRGGYFGHALAHPISTLTMLTGVSLGIYLSSFLVIATMVLISFGCAYLLSGSGRFQHAIDVYVLRQRRAERRSAREEALDRAGVGRDQLAELQTLVDEIHRTDAGRAERRFELEDLLDHYVQLAVSHEKCLRALRQTDRNELVRALREQVPGTRGGRRALVERRLRCWDECRARADRLAEEIATLVELVRLLGQQAACPEPLIDHEALARRIADLEEDDDALREVIAGVQASA
jgi:hypothetical protein